jgi:hypothetical protein
MPFRPWAEPKTTPAAAVSSKPANAPPAAQSSAQPATRSLRNVFGPCPAISLTLSLQFCEFVAVCVRGYAPVHLVHPLTPCTFAPHAQHHQCCRACRSNPGCAAARGSRRLWNASSARQPAARSNMERFDRFCAELDMRFRRSPSVIIGFYAMKLGVTWFGECDNERPRFRLTFKTVSDPG